MVIYLEFFNGQYTLTEALALDVDKVSPGTINGAQKLLTIQHRLYRYSGDSRPVPMLIVRIHMEFTRTLGPTLRVLSR